MKLKLVALFLLLVPALVFAQDAVKKKAYYFYGETCPHCKNVDAYFQENGIYDKYEITKLEVTSNPFNGKFFLEFGKAFGAEDWGGVPTIVFGDKYFVGDQPIIDNFTREIDASENVYELPDPAKIGNNSGAENQNPDQSKGADAAGPIPEEAKAGSRNNYLPVILIILIAAGAGVLIYVNRNKLNT